MRLPATGLPSSRVLVVLATSLAFALVMTSCWSAPMIYAQMPRIAAAKIEEAFDLAHSQKRQVRTELNRMLDWHRREQIPALIQWLDRAEEHLRSSNGFDATEVSALVDDAWTFRDALYNYVYDHAYGFLASLSKEQIDHFIAAQKERNKERYEDLEGGQDNYTAIVSRKWRKRLETWIGALNETQVQRIGAAAAQSFVDKTSERDDVLRLQQEFATLLRQLPPSEPDDFGSTLWKMTPSSRGTPRHQRMLGLLTEIAVSLTADQKTHLGSEIATWRGRLLGITPTPVAPKVLANP